MISWEKLAEVSPDLICTLDPEGLYTYASNASVGMLGINPNEIVGRHFSSLLHPEDTAKTERAVQEVLGGCKRKDFENRLLHKDGYAVPVLWSAAWSEEEGTMFCVGRDITELVESRRRLAESEQRYKGLFENNPDLIFTEGANGLVQEVNGSFCQAMGITREAAENRPASDVLPPHLAPASEESLRQVLLGSTIRSDMELVIGKKRRVFDTVKFPIMIDGEVVGAHTIAKDITPIVQSYMTIQQQASDLYTQRSDLQQFTYIISHNLRAPVANALGLADLLRNQDLDPEKYGKTLSFLQQSLEKLDTVLRDMNTILGVRDSKGNLELEQVDIHALFDQALSSFKEQISDLGFKINTEMKDGLRARANKAYLHSIFYNLLSNAVKYRSAERSLMINVKSFLKDGQVVISFSDNGSGFDMGKAKGKVFKLYKRFHTKQEGRGMGLFLIKSHLDAMGGRVEVHSEEGVGTRFLVYLQKD